MRGIALRWLALLALISGPEVIGALNLKSIAKCFAPSEEVYMSNSCANGQRDRERILANYRRAYSDINTYLTSSVVGVAFEPNLATARKLLEKEILYKKKGLSERKSLASKRMNSANTEPEVLIKALAQLTDLARVDAPEQCTMKVTQVLVANDQAANNAIARKLLATDGSKSRTSREALANVVRIDELVFEAAKRRAQVCYLKYEDKWAALGEKLVEERSLARKLFAMLLAERLPLIKAAVGGKVKSVDDAFARSTLELVRWVDEKLGAVLREQDLKLVLDFVKQTAHQSKKGSRDAKLSQNLLTDNAKATKTDKWLAMSLAYLVRPCEKLVSVLGPIFESMRFDAQLRAHLAHLPAERRGQLDFSADFYRDLVSIEMCYKLEDEKERFATLLGERERAKKLDEPPAAA